MFLNSDDLNKKTTQDPKPAGKLLLNFDDDDEEEEEEPQQKSTPLKIITSKTAEVESGQSKNSASLKSNTLLSAQTTSFQPKSVGLPAPKTTETPVKSSGLPPALAAKLAALNSKKEASTGSSLGQSGSAQKKDSALIYNDDEIEDIGKKYTSVNKTGIVLEKPKADNSEVYSRYKMSASGNANNSPSLAEKQDKGKNDAVNARQKLLDQQRQNFLEKQKMQMKNQSVVTSNANYKTNFDNLKGFLPAEKPELDYEKLQIKEPVVTKLTQQEKEKMKNITPTTLKLQPNSDDEEEKIDENIIKEAQKIKMKAKQNQKEEMVIHTSRNTTRNKKNDEENEKEDDEEENEDKKKKDKKKKIESEKEEEDKVEEEEDEDDCNFGDAKPDPNFEVYDMRTFLLK